MNRRTRVYLLIVIACAAMIAALQPWSALAFSKADWVGAVALVSLGLFAEILTISVTIGGHSAGSSIAFVPLIAACILLPRELALLCAASTVAVTQFAIHRRPLLRGLFNTAQALIAVFLASFGFTVLGGGPGQITVPSFIALAAIFFIANQLLVAAAIALAQGERFASTFARVIGAGGGNLLYDLLVSPIAAVLAILYVQIGVGGIILVFFPLLLVRHAYSTIEKLQRANKDIIQVLVKTIETRDPYTSGHSLRVAKLAKAIAEDLKLSPFKVDEVEVAALVHDIGKIDPMFADLIRKESPLTDEERRIIETHAQKGAEFLRTLSTFRESVIKAVHHHHERYDGKGYPDGISGEQIPLAARIIMVCDSVDAMLSDRPYRDALSVNQVRAELLQCSGSQFDPLIVNSILRENTLERAATLVPGAARAHRALSRAV